MSDPNPYQAPADTRSAPNPRALRLRTLMIVVGLIAAWLGLWRASPPWALLVLCMSGPTLILQRSLVRTAERESGESAGILIQLLMVLAAAIFAVPIFIGLVLIAAFSWLVIDRYLLGGTFP